MLKIIIFFGLAVLLYLFRWYIYAAWYTVLHLPKVLIEDMMARCSTDSAYCAKVKIFFFSVFYFIFSSLAVSWMFTSMSVNNPVALGIFSSSILTLFIHKMLKRNEYKFWV